MHLKEVRTSADEVEHGLVETARARRLSTGQAPYSPLLDQIEEQWAKAPFTAG